MFILSQTVAISATDADEGVNAEISFSLQGETNSEYHLPIR